MKEYIICHEKMEMDRGKNLLSNDLYKPKKYYYTGNNTIIDNLMKIGYTENIEEAFVFETEKEALEERSKLLSFLQFYTKYDLHIEQVNIN